ncbi:phosphate ABC transporter permease PstA [Haloarcula laminariae]|uniref:phosphate ABC transporter permease PstA n=1 Tax=Haloarcula laminariae TaxID=2961577 RepID=UPI00240510B8|nr:phosphate ABC transporter permease PstA [Halomicroarcula sp. FL173]
MATENTDGFGRVSRVRGIVFENLTLAASAVGVVALLLLLSYTILDAVQPFTASTEWYLLIFGAVVVPTLAVGAYCWRHPAVGTVGVQATGATLAGTALATLLVVWLGGQLALLVLVAVVVPTAGTLAYLSTRRQALTVGLQTVGIVVVGGGIASVGSFFAGQQATLVFAVAVGLPAALLARFFLAKPAVGHVGVFATAYGVVGAVLAAVAVEVAAVAGFPVDAATANGLYALGVLLGVGAYAAPQLRDRRAGLAGLGAPFILLAGAAAGVAFHRVFVVTTGLTAALYAVTAVLPAAAFGLHVVRTANEGRIGLALPVVTALGAALALGFNDRYLVLAPNAELAFGLAVPLGLVAYARYVFDRDRPGRTGVLAPVVVGGGLLAALAVERGLGIAGPDSWLDRQFLTAGSHYQPELAGIHPALVGSLYLMFIVTFVAFPVGVGAAIYLEEYAPDNRFARFLEINISNLAGVPSVVYGLLGVAVFIRYGGLRLGAVVAGGFTLSLLILPIVIISAQEAIRSVPDSLRKASYGMGATRWQTIRNVVLPRAIPGILTGTILSLGRAVGETAPLIMVGLAAVSNVPGSLTGQGTAMPLQVFSWALEPGTLFRENVAAAGSMTLLVVLLSMNAVAIIIRNKYQREQ